MISGSFKMGVIQKFQTILSTDLFHTTSTFYPLLIQLPGLFIQLFHKYFWALEYSRGYNIQTFLNATDSTALHSGAGFCAQEWRRASPLPPATYASKHSKASQMRPFTSAALLYLLSPADIFQNFNNKNKLSPQERFLSSSDSLRTNLRN